MHFEGSTSHLEKHYQKYTWKPSESRLLRTQPLTLGDSCHPNAAGLLTHGHNGFMEFCHLQSWYPYLKILDRGNNCDRPSHATCLFPSFLGAEVGRLHSLPLLQREVFQTESMQHCFLLYFIRISILSELQDSHPLKSWMGFGASLGPGLSLPTRPPGYKNCGARSLSLAEAEWPQLGGNALLTFLGFWVTQIYNSQYSLLSCLLINVFLKI